MFYNRFKNGAAPILTQPLVPLSVVKIIHSVQAYYKRHSIDSGYLIDKTTTEV